MSQGRGRQCPREYGLVLTVEETVVDTDQLAVVVKEVRRYFKMNLLVNGDAPPMELATPRPMAEISGAQETDRTLSSSAPRPSRTSVFLDSANT